MRIQKLIFVCLILFRTSQCQINQERLQKAVETGRSHYEEYQNEANKDECWRMAVASLNETCRDLSQSARQRLAIAFANCHWLSAGRRAYECSEEMTIANCTSEMTESAFDVFTQFFNHLEDACFYLQSQLWQEKTERVNIHHKMIICMVYYSSIADHRLVGYFRRSCYKDYREFKTS